MQRWRTRPDTLQSALWSKATVGDTASANTILNIIDKRVRLLGLDRIELESADPMTVVLTLGQATEWKG